MAELFLFQLDQPDSAMATYRRIVDEFPHSDLGPRALYAIGWIMETVRRDTIQAKQIFREVMERYPDSEHTKVLRTRFEKSHKDPAAAVFLRAEALRLGGGSPTDVLTEYQRIVEEYPESSYAAQSAYVVAWMYENVLRDSLRAQAQYAQVVERFPHSPLRKMVEHKLQLEEEQHRLEQERQDRDRAVQDRLKMAMTSADTLKSTKGPSALDKSSKGIEADGSPNRSIEPPVPDSSKESQEETTNEHESDGD